MNFLAWIVLGGFAGWIASIFAGNNSKQGLFSNIFVGIIGAFIGGFIMNQFGKSGVTGFNLYSLFVAALGAFVAIVVAKAIAH